MQGHALKNTAVAIAAGIVYYYVVSNLVGTAAAIAAPNWFIPFMQQHQVLGLVLMSLVTTVPAVALSATLIGYGLARLLDRQYFLLGLLTVCVMVVFSTLNVNYGRGFWGGLRMNALPPELYAITIVLAHWLFLTIATQIFGKRRTLQSQ